jgi:hypothetical protein
MQPCATCDTLMDVISIDSPGVLQALGESLLPHLRQGSLQQVSGATLLSDVAEGAWDDVVSLAFRCTTRGNGYELVAETWADLAVRLVPEVPGRVVVQQSAPEPGKSDAPGRV